MNRSRNNHLFSVLLYSKLQNLKAFWSHIKKLGKEGTDIQDLKVGNEVFTKPRAKAEVLNSQFSSVFNNEETEDIPDPGENPIPTIGTITITTSGNPSKCKIMCFTTTKDPPKREYVFCGEILEEEDSHPYLGGVVLDNKIRWVPTHRSNVI